MKKQTFFVYNDWDCSLQDLLDIPISTVEWDEVSTMVYTTSAEDMMGLPFGPDLVYSYGLTTIEEFGYRHASIALGVSADMPGPEELAAEVAAAKAAGIERIQVYSFKGIYNLPDADQWHAACAAEPAVPEPQESTELMRSLLQFADRIL